MQGYMFHIDPYPRHLLFHKKFWFPHSRSFHIHLSASEFPIVLKIIHGFTMLFFSSMVSITFVFLVSYTQIPYRNGVIGNIYELTAGFTEQISKSLCRASFIDAGIVINQNSESITTVKDLEIEEES